MKNSIPFFGLFTGVALGLALSFVPTAGASRNSSGTYSLPAGNPVVSGTTISSTVHNATQSDIATELTNSLDRSGRGAMLAPLQHSSGTAAAPSVTFSADTDCGLSRTGTNTVTMSTNGIAEQDWSPGGTLIHGDGGIEGGWTVGSKLQVGGDAGVYGSLFVGSAGATLPASMAEPHIAMISAASQPYLYAKDGRGGTGFKMSRLMYDSSTENSGTGNLAHPGWCVQSTDDTGSFTATGTCIHRGGTVLDAGYTNFVTPKNIIKSWGRALTNGAGGFTSTDGFNIESMSLPGGNTLRVSFADDMANTTYAVVASATSGLPTLVTVNSKTVGYVDLTFYDVTGAAVINPAATTVDATVIVTGAQ